MARRRAHVPLNVYLNARLAGRLSRMANGAIEFRYDRSWLDRAHALPISTSLPLCEDRYDGGSVIAVLDNLLPDSEPVCRRVAERVRADGYDAFSLLEKIGRDCAGALRFLPEPQEPGSAGMPRAARSATPRRTVGGSSRHRSCSGCWARRMATRRISPSS